MALTISQITAISYPAVLAEARKPENQWGDSSFIKMLQSMGMIERRGLGPTIEIPIDYRRNPGGDFLATDMTPTSLSKTEVLSAASYTPAEISVPVVWSKGDEAKNPNENQKIAFSRALMENSIQTHDDMLEEGLFTTSTDGFLGMQTIIPDSGQGTVGGISAVTETMWRNPTDSYLADGSDIEATLTDLWNSSSKGSGSSARPKMLVSGAAANSLFESTQVAFQRFAGSKLDAGFTSIAFKNAPYMFSQYGGTRIYGLGAAFKLVVSRQYYRDKGETQETESGNAFVFKIYTALQTVTSAKSRLFVATQA